MEVARKRDSARARLPAAEMAARSHGPGDGHDLAVGVLSSSLEHFTMAICYGMPFLTNL